MGRPLLEPRRNRTFSEGSVRVNYSNKKIPLQGPLRVIRLCVLSIIIPGILVGVPLYMRYYVYGEQVYPVGMSDMRLLDHRVSTTWCQSQTVWSNATFNAYLMENQPQIEKDHDDLTMTRDLNNLEDDMKEYWGFYLLKGSSIIVTACARYPGASLFLIEGHKHLRDCAYIGDDSSEELDELYPNDNNLTEVSQNPANRPEKMKKMSDGVVLRGTQHKLTDLGQDSISEIDKPKKILRTGLKVGNKIHLAYAEHGNRLAKYNIDLEKLKSNFSGSNKNDNIKSNKRSHLQTEYTTSETPTVLSSRELYDELLQKLQKLGSKGKRVLEKLNEKVSNDTTVFNTTKSDLEKSTESTENKLNSRHRLRHNRKFMKMNKASSKTEDEQKGLRREKREILLNTLHDVLNQDEDNDTAMEEEIHNPDELAQIRGSINETTPNDNSNSEFWSSFSSSEERLLNCKGVRYILPLVSHEKCSESLPDHHHSDVFPNSISYSVINNGYYFLVFNSENEVKPNFLRIHFKIEKTKYNVTSPVASCKNQTAACNLPLTFWSSQKVVLQLPVRPNDALWNQEFLAISTCEPRTSIYIACVIAVPLFIILFAFQ